MPALRLNAQPRAALSVERLSEAPLCLRLGVSMNRAVAQISPGGIARCCRAVLEQISAKIGDFPPALRFFSVFSVFDAALPCVWANLIDSKSIRAIYAYLFARHRRKIKVWHRLYSPARIGKAARSVAIGASTRWRRLRKNAAPSEPHPLSDAHPQAKSARPVASAFLARSARGGRT